MRKPNCVPGGPRGSAEAGRMRAGVWSCGSAGVAPRGGVAAARRGPWERLECVAWCCWGWPPTTVARLWVLITANRQRCNSRGPPPPNGAFAPWNCRTGLPSGRNHRLDCCAVVGWPTSVAWLGMLITANPQPCTTREPVDNRAALAASGVAARRGPGRREAPAPTQVAAHDPGTAPGNPERPRPHQTATGTFVRRYSSPLMTMPSPMAVAVSDALVAVGSSQATKTTPETSATLTATS